jgi:hypothetical protein
MPLTKPAGCFVQLVGAPFVLLGAALVANGRILAGALWTLVGALLLVWGRRTG